MSRRPRSYEGLEDGSGSDSVGSSGYSKHDSVERWHTCLAGACCCLVFLSLIVFGALPYHIASQFVEAHTRWAPKIDLNPATAISARYFCPYMLARFNETANELQAFNVQYGYKRIALQSRVREGLATATLDAWYLPSPKGQDNANTIVVQHGNNVNNNDHSVVTIGSMLRKMGWNVLIPTLRNHGNSTATGVITWAATEAYDLLGAWDEVIKDPRGVIGTKKNGSQTAIVGFSMGGYVAQVAFGLEPQIRGLLLDGSVFDPHTELRYQIGLTSDPGGHERLASLISPMSWWFCGWLAGEDLTKLTPQTVLKKTGDNRMIAMVHGVDDVTVPFSQQTERMAYLNQTQFDIVRTWYPRTISADKNVFVSAEDLEKCTPHCENHATKPDEYQAFLCGFFSKVFGSEVSACGLGGTEMSVLGVGKNTEMTVKQLEKAEVSVLGGEIFA